MILVPGNPADWPGQYVLSRDSHSIPGWSCQRVNSYHLSTHPSLPIVPVIIDNRQVGLLLGWVVSPEGRLLNQVHLNSEADFESVIYRNGGRWLLIFGDKVYLDPAGSQPAVFYPEGCIVASSPSLIAAEDNESLVREFDVVARNSWYPFGLTPKQGVVRLLPNHVLDLSTFRAMRHHSRLSPSNVSVTVAARMAIDAVEAVGKAFTTPGLLVGLTAGRDSRMLLAALRSQLGHVRFCTGKGVSRTNPVDVKTAEVLARRFHLQHSVIEPVPASNSDIEDWLDRVGRVRAGDQMTNHRMEDTVADGLLPFGHGAIGEQARGRFWLETDSSHEPLTAMEITKRIKSPQSTQVLEAAQAWLDGLPSQDRFYVLDMLHLEQSVGCWASPGLLGTKRTTPMLFLLNRRDVVDSMLALKHDDKRKGKYIDEVIRLAWPELSTVPFNKPLGLLALTFRIRNPPTLSRVMKKFKSKFL